MKKESITIRWTEFTLVSFLIAFLSLFIISDTSAEENADGNLGYSATTTYPLPDFFGVYAVSEGTLVELKTHPQSGYSGISIAGADILRLLSGITLVTGKVHFIIYHPSAIHFMKIPLRSIARVANQVTMTWDGTRIEKREHFSEEFYHVTDKGIMLRVSPIPENPNMMIRAVPTGTLTSGLWALDLGGELYDFAVGVNALVNADCVDRIVRLTGVTYQPCDQSDYQHNSMKHSEENANTDKSKSILGRWKDEDSVMEYFKDGTFISNAYTGKRYTGTWSIEGNILRLQFINPVRLLSMYTIIEMTDFTYKIKLNYADKHTYNARRIDKDSQQSNSASSGNNEKSDNSKNVSSSVFATNTSNTYHKSKCLELMGAEGLMEFASSKKAKKAGGVPCKICNP